MNEIKIELGQASYRQDDPRNEIPRVTFSAAFSNQFEALKFMADLQKLIISYQPEAE